MSYSEQLDVRVGFGRGRQPHEELQLRQDAAQMTAMEERRRLLAEQRLGEEVVRLPNIGYVAISKLHEYIPVTDADPQEDS